MSVDPHAFADTLLAQRSDLDALGATAFRDTVRAAPPNDDGPTLPRISLELHASGRSSDLALHSVLGRGGMGEVWLAEQASLQRSVAVKRPLDTSREPADALVREARISGSLEHPNIVPIHALGVADDGRPLLVMKRVTGATLCDVAADDAHPAWAELRARYGEREVAMAETIARVADAVAFAHSRGVVHRDIKPENVMVGTFGEVYLMDWGCAVVLDPSTRPSFAGTPAFLAPEMLDPARGPIDARTDVYLLGATLHAALVGRPRHEGDTLDAVLVAALASNAVDYGDSVAPGLAALCNRATHPQPAQRFASAVEFREALGLALRLRSMIALADRIASGATLEHASVPNGTRIKRLEEARHGLAPLVAEWPDNVHVRALLERILHTTVRVALEERLLPIAEGALGALATPVPLLTEGVAQLRAEVDRAQRLATVGEEALLERDVRPGYKGFFGLVVFLALNAVSLASVFVGGKEPTMREVLLADLAALAVVGAATWAYRAPLTANRRIRSMTRAVWLFVVSATVCDALAVSLGQTATQAAPYSLFSAAAAFAAITALIELRPRSRSATGLCSAVLCAEAFWSAATPALATRLLSLSIVGTALIAGFVLFDLARERREEPPAL
jgi:serine/threonine protein kinase